MIYPVGRYLARVFKGIHAMKHAILAGALLFALPAAWAGEKVKEKCPYDTQSCLNSMSTRLRTSGWIGVELEPDEGGVYVVKKVVAGSPAEAAGLQPGDGLLVLNGVPMVPENDKKLAEIRQAMKPGMQATYTVRRGTAKKDVTITLGSWPADLVARYIGEHMLEHAAATVASTGK